MAKVTSKLQLTLPKALAETYGIRPGDHIDWKAAGDSIRIVPLHRSRRVDVKTRLRFFDRATERQARRQKGRAPSTGQAPSDRGWTREELYTRGGTR